MSRSTFARWANRASVLPCAFVDQGDLFHDVDEAVEWVRSRLLSVDPFEAYVEEST